MDKGAIQWQVPLGSMQYFGGGHEPVPQGSIGFGGPIITAGGRAFITEEALNDALVAFTFAVARSMTPAMSAMLPSCRSILIVLYTEVGPNGLSGDSSLIC